MSGSQRIFDEVEKRLVERLASAGLPQSQIALQVLFLLPRDFVDSYSSLYHTALKVGDRGREENWIENADGTTERIGGVGKASGARRTGMREGQTLGGMAGASGGKTYKRAWTVADEKALETKSRIDKKLRKMGREIRVFLGEGVGGKDEGSEERRQCKGKSCKKWIENWKYCPHCGTRQSARGKG